MKNLVKLDEWKIIQESYDAENNEIFESLTSLGNGFMGMRGNHEEDYSAKTLQGTYIAGVYYPDKTKVGWWKNGYPEYFAKVLNAMNFIGIKVWIDEIPLDLATWKVLHYERILDMKHGLLTRSFEIEADNGVIIKIDAERFLSLFDRETGAISYALTVKKGNANIRLAPFINGDIRNKDANYDEKFWLPVDASVNGENEFGFVTMDTKKTDYRVCASMKTDVFVNGNKVYPSEAFSEESLTSLSYDFELFEGDSAQLYKYIGVATNRDYPSEEVTLKAEDALSRAFELTYQGMHQKHIGAWLKKWAHSDIVIEGDLAAQQGIRFNIFHMNQTYTGEDPRLNIGPKGFTGEKYGGSTYWDTEAYCMYFYLGTADARIPKNLLIYRHVQLDKAKENAKKLGVKGALYPMVTMNGEECHNEWEITFEEIHRNGSIAYAIYNYVNYTGDTDYIPQYGFEVVSEIARFWASRVNFVPQKNCYMILGVTGPNEYENNVNNNWYTNRIAAWNLKYAADLAKFLKVDYPLDYSRLKAVLSITEEELRQWQIISEKMYLPEDKTLNIFLQQDGYLDKEQILVKDLSPGNLPLNQKWSWDKILRSCFIKQADVLQGLFYFENDYSEEILERNFDFYEPRTVHESSLSPCVHSILASRLGKSEKAYEMYLRTSRLDLDNYNNDTDDGLHITSMAGTWMSVVLGFGGLRIKNGQLSLQPSLPKAWKRLSFRTVFRGRTLLVNIHPSQTTCELIEGDPLTVLLNGQETLLTCMRK